MIKFLKQLQHHFLPLFVIMVVTVIISVRHLNEPPAYIHAWAQADNYSLALGFQHNGGDLFHPQTLIYNKQQKGYNDPESLVTACDLPLHHWFVSCMMSLTGSRQPWVFRGLTLAVTIAGLWALYLLSFLLTQSRAKSLFVTALTATSPSFAYYSASFLPSLPALAMAMGGLFFYVLHLRDGKNWMLFAGIMLLTLSMMTRTSFAVLWVAVACFQTLRILRHETTLKASWLPFAIGALLFAAWWLWSLHLRHEYSSLFLGSLLPARSWEEARNVLQNVHDRWRFHYFQQIQHWIYVAVATGAVITFAIKKKNGDIADNKLSLWWFWGIWMLGELFFAAAMSIQYSDHDYYFLDSLFLPIVISCVLLLSEWPNPTKRWMQITILPVVLIIICFMTVEACQMQKVRRLEGTDVLQTAIRYKGANNMLENAGLGSQNLRFMTLFSYPQNLPFTMMDREGYSVMWTIPEIVEHALTFDYDYIIVEDEVYRKEFDEAPYILPRLRRLAGNGELSVCELSDTLLHPTADHFFE